MCFSFGGSNGGTHLGTCGPYHMSYAVVFLVLPCLSRITERHHRVKSVLTISWPSRWSSAGPSCRGAITLLKLVLLSKEDVDSLILVLVWKLLKARPSKGFVEFS